MGVCLLGIAGWLVGQAPHGPVDPHHPAPPAATKRGTALPPTHRPQPELTPYQTLTYLQGAVAAAAARRSGAAAETGQPTPPAAERPAGAGRYLAAVVTCADADLDCAAWFGVPRTDLLVLASPAGLVAPEAVALLETMATEQRLSLVILVGHDDCASRRIQATSPARQLLARRLAAAGCDAAIPAAATLALLAAQREALLAASDELAERAAQDRLRVVTAICGRGGELRWLGPTAAALPIAPVK
jgi:hypothetical protein